VDRERVLAATAQERRRIADLIDSLDEAQLATPSLCAGWDVAQVRGVVAQALHETVEPLVYAEAQALIAEHREQGDEIVILSASGQEVVEPIAAMIGADRSVATRMAVVDGRYTGDIDYYCFGEAKAEAARAIAAERGYDLARCRAYSDSITDLPLLSAVGFPTVVNPDRALRRIAQERGWPVLTFAQPVALRAKLRRRAGVGALAATAALGLLCGALGAGLTIRQRRDGR